MKKHRLFFSYFDFNSISLQGMCKFWGKKRQKVTGMVTWDILLLNSVFSKYSKGERTPSNPYSINGVMTNPRSRIHST